jgi:hypothetical protein
MRVFRVCRWSSFPAFNQKRLKTMPGSLPKHLKIKETHSRANHSSTRAADLRAGSTVHKYWHILLVGLIASYTPRPAMRRSESDATDVANMDGATGKSWFRQIARRPCCSRTHRPFLPYVNKHGRRILAHDIPGLGTHLCPCKM